MAHLTAGTFLMTSTDGTAYTKLIDITEFPDLGSAPEAVDVTTLTDSMHKYIEGLMDTGGALTFNAYLDSKDFKAVDELKGELIKTAVWFGGTVDESTGLITPSGAILKVKFDSYIRVNIAGAGVGDVIPVTVTSTPNSAFVYEYTDSE